MFRLFELLHKKRNEQLSINEQIELEKLLLEELDELKTMSEKSSSQK